MSSYVGYHFPMCVCDIALGVIPIDQVELVYSDSTAQTQEEWEAEFAKQMNFWWQKNTEPKVAVAQQLIAEGKVYQPLLHGEALPPLPDPGSVWTEDGRPIIAREMTERYKAMRGEIE